MEAEEAWRLTDRLNAQHGKGDPFAAAIRATRMAMIITDPRLPDNPIVFVNDAFLALSGYDRGEIMGTNCRFLQGPDTNQDEVRRVREAIANRTDVAADLLNYRKDGTTFWNALYMSPVINEAGELVYFFASQLDVTNRYEREESIRREKAEVERQVVERTSELTDALRAKTHLAHEVDHRVRNNLQMISAMLAMQARSIEDPQAREAMRLMLDRVDALGTVHKLIRHSDDATRFDIADCARELATGLVEGSGRTDIRLRLELESVLVPVEKAAPAALLMNELVSHALSYAFTDTRPGKITVTVEPIGSGIHLEVSDNGDAPAGPGNDPRSFGERLLSSLARQLGASIERVATHPGTRVVVRFQDEPTERVAA